MRPSFLNMITLSVLTEDLNHRSEDVFVPVGVAVGSAPQVETEQYAPFTLDETDPVATLDYGGESAGYPFFEVSSLTGPVQVEVKYTEEFGGLNQPFSDGPFSYSNQLGNSFRVETFNFTSAGRLVAPLLQGGQKWQSLRLLTPGSVSFSAVGYEATVDTVLPGDLPGKFSSDDEVLNEIWKLGARASTAACFDKGSQKAIWEVDAEKGVLARNARPSLSAEATAWGNYTLEFDTLIQKGGSWWSVVRFFLQDDRQLGDCCLMLTGSRRNPLRVMDTPCFSQGNFQRQPDSRTRIPP